MKERVRVQVLSQLRRTRPGTLVVDEDEIVEKEVVAGIAYSRDEAQDHAARRAGPARASPRRSSARCREANVNVDMIVQNVSADGTTDMTFTVGRRRPAARAGDARRQRSATIGYAELLTDPDVAKISVVGVGMRSHAGVASTMFRTLADKGINIQVISTSEIKVSVLIGDGIHRAGRARAAHGLRARCADTPLPS